MTEEKNDPDEKSSDYEYMEKTFCMARDFMSGADAVRGKREKYLPKFPSEVQEDYDFRVKNAKFTNIYRKIVENLASRPFEKELFLQEGTSSPKFDAFIENVDGRGNHLHQFAQTAFCDGISKGIGWILVDYTKGIPVNATIEQERLLGARPFWVYIDPLDLIAVYSDFYKGEEIITHARICENVIERVGFKEVERERVRVFNREKLPDGSYAPATWEVWEEKEDEKTQKEYWELIESGEITIGIIPLVPFWAGKRLGSSFRVIPTLQDALELQKELYQEDTKLKSIKDCTAFPMLTANNIAPELDDNGRVKSISVGAKTILYTGVNADNKSASWDYVEPSSESLKFLAADINQTKQDLHELGRQPLTAQTGNLTVVTTIFASQGGNAAISVWALNIKNTLENAFKITGMWLKEIIEPEVGIKVDFSSELRDSSDMDVLLALYNNGGLSLETIWREAIRRNILSPDFKPALEYQKIVDGMTNTDLVTVVDSTVSQGQNSSNIKVDNNAS